MICFIHSPAHNSSHQLSLPNDVKIHCHEQAGISVFARVARNKMKPAKGLCLPPPSPITVSGTWYPPDIIQGVITGIWSVWTFLLHFYKLSQTCVFISLSDLSRKQWEQRRTQIYVLVSLYSAQCSCQYSLDHLTWRKTSVEMPFFSYLQDAIAIRILVA